MKKTYNCLICKARFVDYICNKRKFCSRKCSNKNHSVIFTGKSATWLIGKTPWNKGLKGLTRNKNGNWKGGRYENQGYVYVLMPDHPLSKKNGYVAKHRIIIEKHLGRFTTKIESPHHKNKIRNDNRIKNLILFKNKAIHNKADHGHKITLSDIIFDGAKTRRKTCLTATT